MSVPSNSGRRPSGEHPGAACSNVDTTCFSGRFDVFTPALKRVPLVTEIRRIFVCEGAHVSQIPTVSRDTPANVAVQALLARHFELMRASSPTESCHVMEPDALLERDAVLFAARDGDNVLGVGALTVIAPEHGELKSMHTVAEARGRGVGRAVLATLIAEARAQGLTRLSLETGSAEMFAPARALYAAHGFEECPPFGTYVLDPLSVFMTRTL